MFREGLLVVVSGPSGTGKGTVLKLIEQRNGNVRLSTSATTRKPREGEVDGKNYFFKSTGEFKQMIEQDELIEWVEYCNNYYGTPKKHIEDLLKQGRDVILEIEVEGAVNIKNKFPDSVLVFVLPPSFEELKKRIEGRGTEKIEVIEKRLLKAKKEVTYLHKYDYMVINDDLDAAVDQLNSILTAEKLKYTRNQDVLNKIGM